MPDPVAEALKRSFAEKRIVFWYDEGGRNRLEFETTQVEGVEKLEIAGNEFGIKYKILIEQPEGKFLVYSDKARPDPADDWLYDLYLAGASFSTDPASLVLSEMGLPDEAGIRNLMTDKLVPLFRSDVRKREIKALMETDDGRMTAEKVELILISVLCKVKNHAKIEYVLAALLKELAEDRSEKLDELDKYGLEEALWRRLASDYGYANRPSRGIADFANCLFHDAFSSPIKSEPPQLSHQALAFFNDWKNGADTRQVFLRLADKSAARLGIKQAIADVDVTRFEALDVYREIDDKIVAALVADVERGSIRPDDVARIVGHRKDGCRFEEFKSRYQAIEAASGFFSTLALASLTACDASDAVTKYAGSWYKIDQQYRLFIEYYNEAKARDGDAIDLFAALKTKVDGYYIAQYLSPQSVNFQAEVNKLASWKFEGHKMQQNFWRDRIAHVDASVCVIISDALRYEVAAELADQINATHRYSASIEPMVGVLPSYTQLGMAALLPHEKLDLCGGPDGTPNEWAYVDGKNTRGLEARKSVLEAVQKPKATATTYKDVMEMTRPERRAFESSADVLYIYHDTIDQHGDRRDMEDETPAAAREAINEIMSLIRKIGSDYRIGKFIVTSDHGFLYQDRPLETSQYVEDEDCIYRATVCKNRFVIGMDLPKSNVLANYTSEQLGLEFGADIRIAKGVMRLHKQGSGVKYVHGGASLQEIVVPVVEVQHVRSRKADVVPVEAEILVDGAGRITTHSFSVSVYQSSPVGEEFAKRVVKLSLLAADGTLLSDEVKLVLDSEAENIPDRTKSTTLTLNRAANALREGSVVLKMETGKERANGSYEWDMYKTKQMTLRLAIQNFFD